MLEQEEQPCHGGWVSPCGRQAGLASQHPAGAAEEGWGQESRSRGEAPIGVWLGAGIEILGEQDSGPSQGPLGGGPVK